MSGQPPSGPVPLTETVPLDLFRAEVIAWARRLDVRPREVHVRSLRRKWASCSSSGRLTFTTGLLRQPAPFRAQVIVHELLHLRVPNHGPLFRSLLRAYLAEHGVADGTGSPSSRLSARTRRRQQGLA
jgi:hypothetical protein